MNSHVEDALSFLRGDGDCDVLQSLYNGRPELNFWAGWRDKMDDLGAFLVMYAMKGITVVSACGLTCKEDLDDYNQKFREGVGRVIEFD